MQDYLQDSARTVSPDFHGDLVTLRTFEVYANQAIEALKALDSIKKTLFYGRELSIQPAAKLVHQQAHSYTMASALEWLTEDEFTPQEAIDLIHGILGKATEAGELLELLCKTVVFGAPFDYANLTEEIGDGLWYDALLLRANGSDFETAMKINLDKLHVRFPEKFTSEAANVRDLESEKKALDGKN